MNDNFKKWICKLINHKPAKKKRIEITQGMLQKSGKVINSQGNYVITQYQDNGGYYSVLITGDKEPEIFQYDYDTKSQLDALTKAIEYVYNKDK